MTERKQDIAEERRQQILIGALQVFARSGFVKATNKEIAEAAGIQSAGLIYHYFKDKADLLRAVIERFSPPSRLLAHSEEVMQLPPAEALTHIGNAYVQLSSDPNIGACVRVILNEALRDPAFARMFLDIGPLRVLRFLSTYLKQQMDAGLLRTVDPEVAARCFVGPLALSLLAQNIFQVPELSYADPETIVATTVDIFLRGMATGE